MANVGNIDVQIRADISQLQSSLRSMQTQLASATNNIRNQTNNISNSFNNMGNMISNTIKSIIIYKGLELLTSGLADTVRAFNQVETSLLGLNSILTAQGKSFSSASQFIKEYTQDGLIPMSDAVTAFKTLSSAGYSMDETEKVLIRLKDSAAFGRQAALSMGEAVKGAAEGIKNENPILVNYLPSQTAMMAA